MHNPHLATFSILAQDPKSGLMAVGGTSCWFAYGSLVPFVEGGVGVVATQAECNMDYGPEGLKRLKGHESPEAIVKELTGADTEKDIRQLLVMNAQGKVAAFTGNKCVKFTDQHVEDNFGVAGNMLANEKVIPAVVKNFSQSKLPLGERVIKALQAGQQAGGDVRGKQSAALWVAETTLTGLCWRGLVHDLRVDDNPEPLKELERLYRIGQAFQEMTLGDTAYYEAHDNAAAIEHYQQAMVLAPNNPQPAFWYAKLLDEMGKKSEAKNVLGEIVKLNPQWSEYWERLQETG